MSEAGARTVRRPRTGSRRQVGDDGDRDDERRAGDDQQRSRPSHPLESLGSEERDEPGHEDEVQGEAKATVDQGSDRFERQEDERWDEREGEGEQHDVSALRATHGEELGVPREKVEDRLGECEGAESGKLCAGRRQLA